MPAKIGQTTRTGKRSSRASSRKSRATAGKNAQVRLSADEVASLNHVMQVLNIDSTSDALREGLRLLQREAAEREAAEELDDFYGGRPAPLPDAALPPTAAELAAGGDDEW